MSVTHRYDWVLRALQILRAVVSSALVILALLSAAIMLAVCTPATTGTGDSPDSYYYGLARWWLALTVPVAGAAITSVRVSGPKGWVSIAVLCAGASWIIQRNRTFDVFVPTVGTALVAIALLSIFAAVISMFLEWNSG